MHLTWLLVLAHVVGDFVLQTDWVFRQKVTRRWGVLLHVGICVGAMVAALLPFFHDGTVVGLVVVLAGWHLLLDWGKGSLRSRWGRETIALFVGDQVLHVTGIVGAVWLYCKLGGSPLPAEKLQRLLIGPETALVVTAVLVASFAAAPLIYQLQQCGRSGQSRGPIPFPSFRARVPGYVERALGTPGVYWGGLATTFLLAIGLRWVGAGAVRKRAATIEAFVGIMLCLVMGIGARLLTSR